MKKAFFYDTLCGLVYRCMFAGIDEYGHAQWVNITPGEESKTLDDVVIDEDLEGTRFILISVDDEPVHPEIIVKVLCKVMESSIDEPLELEFGLFENNEFSKRKGKYLFFVDDKKEVLSFIATIDGFNNLNDLLHWIKELLQALEVTAEIPILAKEVRLSEELCDQTNWDDLNMFSKVNIRG